ncbi:hypothetical protein THARTR1_02073 [Trichoderma harzianum]|uniref:DSBA-like thioredoxin domain-containing protein n=1 Tax=Trichoderma harzianum TaxID=5544 RepID=A0A2K0UJJ8_TRIHA|nr:hypothetical protein THARTR1_02073 [Trichoderma harzianum]
MGGKIECFMDLGESWTVLLGGFWLAAYGVEVEIHPVLLGGINHISGNRPPWTNEIKGKYLKYDSRRAAERVGLFGIQGPPDLMAVSHTVSPLRALHYIKANYPEATFLATFESLLMAFWTPPNVNLIPEENLRAVLLGATEKPGKSGSKKLFTEEEVETIMKARSGMKDVLMAITKRAADQGAFGTPWFWVTNAKGEQEPFFGSDRFHHIYKFLDIPFQDIAVLPPSKL